MSKPQRCHIELSMCEECPSIHLELVFPDGTRYSQGLHDEEWDDMFIAYAMMKQARDKAEGRDGVAFQ